MGIKLRRMLIFLLIILTEPNMPAADRRCEQSSSCKCIYRGLTSIPQDLPISITHLNLEGNNITTVNCSTLLHYRNLTRLDLTKNHISIVDCLPKLPRLQQLYLQKNETTNIEPGALANLPMLQQLFLRTNHITMIKNGTFAALPSLRELGLSYNKITMIQAGAFENLLLLQTLTLAHNQIKMIQPDTFANLACLISLNLQYNQIRKIEAGTFANLPSLLGLYLYSNQIQMIHPGTYANLPQLGLLVISSNQITMIQARSLTNLPKLRHISLSSNKITRIQSGAFANLPQLTILDLRSNDLFAFSPSDCGLLPSIPNIKLHGNPWHCDCRMLPFRLNTTTFPSFKNQIICAQPSKLLGEKLSGVSLEELVCHEPAIFTLPVDIHEKSPKNYSGSVTSHYQWSFQHNGAIPTSAAAETKKIKATRAPPLEITSNIPEVSNLPKSVPSFPLSAHIGSICGPVVGIVLISTIILTFWCKRRTRNPLFRLNPNVVVTDRGTNKAGSVTTSDDQKKCDNHQDQTENGQFQAVSESNTMTIADAVTSGNDQIEQGQSQDIPLSHTGTAVAVVPSGCDQTEHGQSHVITDSLDVKNISYGQGPTASQVNSLYKAVAKSQAITESNTNITAALMTRRHDQRRQIQSQAIDETLNARNISYGTRPTASQLNSLYKSVAQSHTITESNENITSAAMTNGHDQICQSQSQAITESLDARNISYGKGPTVIKSNSIYANVEIA